MKPSRSNIFEYGSFNIEASTKQKYVEVRIPRQWLWAVVISVAFHIILLLLDLSDVLPKIEPAAQAERSTIDVSLAPLPSKKIDNKTPELETIKPEAPKTVKRIQTPKVPKRTPKKLSKPKAKVKPKPNTQTVVTTPSTRPGNLNKTPPKKTKALPPPPVPDDFPDMNSYVKAVRQHRLAAGDPALKNQAAIEKQRAPTAEEKRDAIIARNLEPEGQNGLFRILSKDSQYARFSYRGWTKDASIAKQEIINVEAGPNGDIELAIIKRMIQIIRKHYQEDFNWHSQKFDRVIVLSARPEDTEGLEDFLRRELFGDKQALPIKY